MEDKKNNLFSIQALRFLAALMVVLCHSTFYTKERLASSIEVFDRGANGVELFFVISGFVIALSSKKLISLEDGWKTFAFKRIIRIVPLYWFFTFYKLLVMNLSPALVLHSKLSWQTVLKSFLFIPAYNKDGNIEPILGVGWTLNFEMFFYLLFMLAIFLRINQMAFIGIILSFLTILSFFVQADWPVELKFYANPIVINFYLGMVAAYLLDKEIKLPRLFSYIVVLTSLLILFTPITNFIKLPGFSDVLVMGLASFLIVFCSANLENRYAISIPSYIVFLGAASYSLYLIHPLVSPISPVIFNRLNINTPVFSIALSLVLAIIAAVLVYLYIERPVSKFLNKKEFIKRQNPVNQSQAQ